MHQSTATPAFHRRGPVAAAIVLAGALVLLPAAVFGQDVSPSPAAETPPPAADASPPTSEGDAPPPATDDLAALIPSELAGVPVDPERITVLVGEEMIQGNESSRRQYEAAAAATGVAITDMAQVNAFVETPEGDGFFLSVLRVPGADAMVVFDAVLAVAQEEQEELTAEPGEVGGLAVMFLSEPSIDEETTYVVYPLGDRLWIALGDEAAVIEALTDVTEG